MMTENKMKKKLYLSTNTKKRRIHKPYIRYLLGSNKKSRINDMLFDEILRKYAKAWIKLSKM